MAHVEELEHLTIAVLPGRHVALGHLPPAGDARLAGEELVAAVAELVGLLERHGPGADHGQVAREHVDELRQLVQARPPQKAAHARDARVVVELLLAPPRLQLLGCHVALGVGVRVRHHAAELPDVDPLTAEPDALLTEEGLTGAVDADRGAHRCNRNRQHSANAGREADVERPLDEAVADSSRLGRRNGVVRLRALELAASVAMRRLHIRINRLGH